MNGAGRLRIKPPSLRKRWYRCRSRSLLPVRKSYPWGRRNHDNSLKAGWCASGKGVRSCAWDRCWVLM